MDTTRQQRKRTTKEHVEKEIGRKKCEKQHFMYSWRIQSIKIR